MWIYLLILCVTAITGQRCSKEHSYDLTNSLFVNDKYVSENGVEFPPQYVYEGEIDGINKTFGCECSKKKSCYTKCCPPGFVRVYRDCVLMPEKDLMQNDGISLFYVDTYTKKLDVKDANLLYGIKCDMYKEDANWYLQEDGKLFIELPNSIPPWMKRDPDQYCVDTFVWTDPNTGQNYTKLDALVCFEDEEEEHSYTSSIICMLISCFFFIVTIAVYAWLPELQNLHGRVLMAYLTCMCVGFAFLSTMQIMLTVDNITVGVCVGLTFVIYFALLSSFFWLNVMCFDIWWTFSGKRGLSLEKLSLRARFCAYAAYAFGFPSGLTALMAALEFSGLPAHPLMPMLRQQGCFLYGRSKLIYLYVPIIILYVANMAFFILTALKITQIKKQMQKTLKSKDSCSTDQHRNDRQRLLLYIKLFTIMGANWILEVVSALYPQASGNVWRFVDAYNVMIGVFIFIIFVCKRKIFRLMKKRFNESFRISHSESGDMRQMSHRDVKNSKEYQQQRGSLDTVPSDARPPDVSHSNHVISHPLHQPG